MPNRPEPPAKYQQFVTRFPKLGQAWGLCAEAGKEGPLSEKTARLVKLAMSMAAMREGAVHSGVRRALELGIAREEIEQLVALLPGTIGFPGAAAVYTWVEDVFARRKKG
jgi:4-carboxymuconolactone decarboxylase